MTSAGMPPGLGSWVTTNDALSNACARPSSKKTAEADPVMSATMQSARAIASAIEAVISGICPSVARGGSVRLQLPSVSFVPLRSHRNERASPRSKLAQPGFPSPSYSAY